VTETFITYVKENCMCCVTNIIHWMFWTHDCFHRFDVFAFYKTALVNGMYLETWRTESDGNIHNICKRKLYVLCDKHYKLDVLDTRLF